MTQNKDHLTIHDYNYQKYSPEFKQMRKDLIAAGCVFFVIGLVILVSLTVLWNQSPTLVTFGLITIGGICGVLLPWIGVDRKYMIGNPFGEPEHLTTYEQRLQIVIWKFRKHGDMFLITLPYFVWFVYQAMQRPLPTGGFYEDMLFVFFLSAVGALVYSMSILFFQVYWSIRREIKSNEERK